MSKQSSSIFGQRVRFARERLGIPQDRLGVMIGLDEGCSSARISRYESGVHQPPFEIAERIAEVLQVPTAFLYCRDAALAEVLLDLHALTAKQMAVVRRSISRQQKMIAR